MPLLPLPLPLRLEVLGLVEGENKCVLARGCFLEGVLYANGASVDMGMDVESPGLMDVDVDVLVMSASTELEDSA